MRVAIGLKSHSGWAAAVVVAADDPHRRDGHIHIVERFRLDFLDPATASWAKQPYHAAEKLKPAAARDLVQRGIDAARANSIREITSVRDRLDTAGHELAACAILTGAPMPPWTVDEILAVHFRMHKAEGVLFQDALARAAEACQIKLVRVPEKDLATHAAAARSIAALGKSIGPPWGKDQKDAALAALIALASKL